MFDDEWDNLAKTFGVKMPKAPVPQTPTLSPDEDYAVRTIIGEASTQGQQGWDAVAGVIKNRAKGANQSYKDIVLAPSQFEPWSHKKTRDYIQGIRPDSPIYQKIAQSVIPVLRGEKPDPTGGATHFYAPKAQAALGRAVPDFDNGKGVDIGDHRFFNLGYSGKGRHGTTKTTQVAIKPEIDFDALSAQFIDSPQTPQTSTPQVDFDALSTQFLGIPPQIDDPYAQIGATTERVQPVTEKPDTIVAQIQSANDPNVKTRFGVLSTDPSQASLFANQPNFKPFETKEGTLWLNTGKIFANKKLKLKNEKDLQQYLKNPKALTTLIGIAEDVGNNTRGTAVVARGKDGTELATGVVTNPVSAVEQAQNYKDQFPDAEIEVTDTDVVTDRRKQGEEIDRLAPTSMTGEADDIAPQYPVVQQKPSLPITRPKQAVIAPKAQPKAIQQAKTVTSVSGKMPATPELTEKDYQDYFTANPDLIDTPANRNAFTEMYKANRNFGKDVEVSAEVATPQGQVSTQTAQSTQGGAPQTSTNFRDAEARFRYDTSKGNFTEQDKNASVSRLVDLTGVDPSTVRSFLDNHNWYEVNETESDRAEQAKADVTQVRKLPARVQNDIVEYATRRKANEETLKVAKQKVVAENPNLDVSPEMLDAMAALDSGLVGRNEGTKRLLQAKNDYIDWLVEKGYANEDAVNKAFGIPTKDKETSAFDWALMKNPLYNLVAGTRKEDAPVAIRKSILEDIDQYGSLANATKVYKEQKAEREFNQRAGVGNTGQALKTAARYIAKIPSTLLDTAAMVADFDPGSIAYEYVTGSETGARQALRGVSDQWREAVDKDLALIQNPAYKNDFIANELAEGLTQMAVQMIAAPLTGGASLAFPAMEGATGAYREAEKGGADRSTRLAASTVGTIMALPGVFLKAKYLKALTGSGQLKFVENLTGGLFSKLAKQFGEKEARQLTKDTVNAFIKKGLSNIALGFGGEYGQEQLEDVGNKTLQKLTYKPEMTWEEVMLPTSAERRGYLSAGLSGIFGGAFETGIEKMSNAELKKGETELDKMLANERISQTDYKRAIVKLGKEVEARIKRGTYFAKDASIKQAVKADEFAGGFTDAEKKQATDVKMDFDPNAEDYTETFDGRKVEKVKEQPADIEEQRGESFGEWRKGKGVTLRRSTDSGEVAIGDPLEVKRIERSIDKVLDSITGDSDIDEIFTRIRQYIDPHANETPQIARLIKERIAAAGGASTAEVTQGIPTEPKKKVVPKTEKVETVAEPIPTPKADGTLPDIKTKGVSEGRGLRKAVDIPVENKADAQDTWKDNGRTRAIGEPSLKELGLENKNWREVVDSPQLKDNLLRRHGILRAIAENGTEQEMSDVLDRRENEKYGNASNIAWDIAKNPKAPVAIQQRAQAMYDNIFPPLSDKQRVKIDRERIQEQLTRAVKERESMSTAKDKGSKQALINQDRYIADLQKRLGTELTPVTSNAEKELKKQTDQVEEDSHKNTAPPTPFPKDALADEMKELKELEKETPEEQEQRLLREKNKADQEQEQLLAVSDEIKVKKLKEHIGRKLSAHAVRVYTEDFVDEDNGEVVTLDRNEILVPKGEVITEEIVEQLKDWQGLGIDTIFVYKKGMEPIAASVITEPVAQKDKDKYDMSRPEIEKIQKAIQAGDKIAAIVSKLDVPDQTKNDLDYQVHWLVENLTFVRDWVHTNKKQNKMR